MFEGCKRLKTVNGPLFEPDSKVENVGRMFYNCN